MANLNTGELWERDYRLRARHVAKGVRISPNGRGDTKATQIFWVRSEINDDGSTTKKTEYASSIHLPWKKEAVEKNLNFIKETIEKSQSKPTTTLKQHLDETLKQDDEPMTKRATKDEQELRVQEACTMLSLKVPPSHIVRHMAQKYDISLQQARDYVRQAKGLLLEAFDLEDVKWQYLSAFESLQEDRLDAREANNFSAAVGATKAMINLLKLLPTIDPAGCWNAEIQANFNSFVEDRLAPKTGKIPKESIETKKSPKGYMSGEWETNIPEEEMEDWYKRAKEQNLDITGLPF